MTAAIAHEPVVTYVRPAKVPDIPWLMDELRKFAEFYGMPPLFPSPNEARRGLLGYIEQKVLFIAAENGHPIGFIGGEVRAHPYNSQLPVLVEHFWWVCEERRGGRAGLLLLDELHKFADAHGYRVAMSLLPHSPINERTLLKRGYRLAEKAYLRERVPERLALKELKES